MQRTIQLCLMLGIVSGLVFAGCKTKRTGGQELPPIGKSTGSVTTSKTGKAGKPPKGQKGKKGAKAAPAKPGSKGKKSSTPPLSKKWRCGDNKCSSSAGEDCVVCSKDCGACNGCRPNLGVGCKSCKCEACVCKKLPHCCGVKKGTWDAKCVKACKEECGGCGFK